MGLLEDFKRADWSDPGQWSHTAGFVSCRILHGKNCSHITGLGTFTERWPEVYMIPGIGIPALLGFVAGRLTGRRK